MGDRVGAEVPRLSRTWDHPELTWKGTQVLVAGAQLLLMCPPGAGDILGNALQNVDSLLAMPYGCGEQNMVRFAPNIYIQQYLEKTGQLLPHIRAKAQGFLQSGQWDPDPLPGRGTTVPQPPPHSTWLPWAPLGTETVSCAHVLLQATSGSCGTNTTTAPTVPLGTVTARAIPGEGSAAAAPPGTQGVPVLTLSPVMSVPGSRLTAFVLKSFGQARAYVAIEERHITDALRWLQQHQRTSGCFRSVGKLFNNALQVGQGWGGDPECGLGSGGVLVLVSQPPVSRCPLAGRCLGRALTLGIRDGSDAGAGAAQAGEDGPFFPTGPGGVGTAAGTGDWPFQATLQPELGTAGRTGQHWGL